jgi:hypothetical protein
MHASPPSPLTSTFFRYNYWYSQWVFGITEFVVMYILFLRLDTRYQLKVEHAGFFNTRDCCEFILRPTLIRVIAAAVIAIATFHTSQGTVCLHLVSRHQPFAQAC